MNVEKKSLLIWNRRGGRLLKRVLLKNVELLRVIPDEVRWSCSMLESPFFFRLKEGGILTQHLPREWARDTHYQEARLRH